MNYGDVVNDFLCEVRERGGFANDKNFDLIVGQVFFDKIKAAIEAEREAIKEIIDGMEGPILKRDMFPFLPTKYLDKVLIPAPELIAAIKARSEGKEEKPLSFVQEIREEADRVWDIGKRIEKQEAGKKEDPRIWYELKQFASDMHELARKLKTRSEG